MFCNNCKYPRLYRAKIGFYTQYTTEGESKGKTVAEVSLVCDKCGGHDLSFEMRHIPVVYEYIKRCIANTDFINAEVSVGEFKILSFLASEK